MTRQTGSSLFMDAAWHQCTRVPQQRIRTVVGVSLLLTLSTAHAKTGTVITLGTQGVPPITRQTMTVSSRSVRAADMGNSACEAMFITKDPVATVKLDASARLLVTVHQQAKPGQDEVASGFLMRNSVTGQHHCLRPHNHGLNNVWMPGTYDIHPAWNPADQTPGAVTMTVVVGIYSFEQSVPIPTFPVEPGKHNPWSSEWMEYRGAWGHVLHHGFQEVGNRRTTLAPLTTLNVDAEGSATVEVAPVDGLVMRHRESGMFYHDSNQGTLTGRWPKGTYDVYPLSHGIPTADARFAVRIYRDREPIAGLPEIPIHRVRTLNQPLVVTVNPPREPLYGGYGARPDFIIALERPLKLGWLELLNGLDDQGFIFDHHAPNKPIKFRRDRGAYHVLKVAELKSYDGGIAVYLKAGKATGPVTMALVGEDTRLDPMLKVADPPAGLSVTERALNRWYPFITRGLTASDAAYARERVAWQKVDPSLLVFPRYDLDDASVDQSYGRHVTPANLLPKTGEPLVVVGDMGHGSNKVRIWTADLSSYVVFTSALTAERPDRLAFPAKPRPHGVDNYDALVGAASPAMKRRLAQYDKRRERTETCWADYFFAHHADVPGDLFEITRINGKTVKVENFSDKISAQAERRCGVIALLQAKEALVKELVVDTVEMRQKELNATRTRLRSLGLGS